MDIHSNKKNFVVDPEKYEQFCTCGNQHPPISVKMYSGEDAYSILAEDCRKMVGSGSVLLVDDENTHKAAGDKVVACLEENSVRHRSIKLPGDTRVTDHLAQRIYDESFGQALIIAVGAGTINDLGKYAAGRRNIPYWAVPTAPSMNGYTSSIAAVNVEGVKRTMPVPPARFIYINPEVIRRAPLKLRQAGLCDVLAKSVSDIDWQIESSLFNGNYCALPSAIVAESESSYMEHPEGIIQGHEKTILGLFKGLLIFGVTMSLAGSSAPASGGEHLISHFLDMREDITGRIPELHGLQVGAGVILSASCYRKLALLAEKDLKNTAEHIFEADAGKIPDVWGDLAGEVEKRFSKKRDHLLAFDKLLPENWQTLKTLFSKVKKPKYFIDLIRRAGFEMTLESLNLSKDEFRLAALSARTIRERITVLDISAHTGVLENATEETLELLT
jgi:glycerol-1-phosphate dehydrogenase [NAD(P)+]